MLGPDGQVHKVLLQRVDEHRLEGRVVLRGDGVYRAAVKVGDDQVYRVPPVTLPYSPEFERQADPRRGEKVLRQLCDITGGHLDPPASELLAGPRTSRGITPLSDLCAWLAAIVLLAEIAVRRLQLDVPQPRWAAVRERLSKALPRRRSPTRPDPARATPGEPRTGSTEPDSTEPDSTDPGSTAPDSTRPAATEHPEPRSPDLGTVLDRAKAKAGRRTT